ncbi:glycoside hydrolase family 43 protein [Sphingobacterium sp. LRF_L2]|uniref:glycoside hydrolase family 43 protein n=1 Tax=Sphingobacterium sp. LRF_L2 TaxID=3369421 RepID=UPI003F5E9F10
MNSKKYQHAVDLLSLLACHATVLFSFFLVLSCKPGNASEQRLEEADSATVFLADPTILAHNGIYYLYGTDGETPDRGFRVYQSTDLKNWGDAVGVHDGFALINEEVFGDVGFWAPQVWYEKGVFYMAYTANEKIAIATSESPLGPFIQKEQEPLIKEGKQIDAFILEDGDKRYLYYVKLQEGNRIFMAELATDYSSIVEGTEQECIHATLDWENIAKAPWPVTEGPTVFKYQSHYYMFYSANDFRHPNYAVGVAVADNPVGPWVKVGNEALLSIHNTGWSGTGHGDVFRVGNDWYYVCHTHFSATQVGPRRTAIVPFVMSQGQDPFAIPTFDGAAIRFFK